MLEWKDFLPRWLLWFQFHPREKSDKYHRGEKWCWCFRISAAQTTASFFLTERPLCCGAAAADTHSTHLFPPSGPDQDAAEHMDEAVSPGPENTSYLEPILSCLERILFNLQTPVRQMYIAGDKLLKDVNTSFFGGVREEEKRRGEEMRREDFPQLNSCIPAANCSTENTVYKEYKLDKNVSGTFK